MIVSIATVFVLLGLFYYLLLSENLSSTKFHLVHRPHYPEKPRILQLLADNRTAALLETDELPQPGSHELIARYVPLQNDKVKQLKAASGLDKGKCQRIADWQSGHNPTCNNIHEMSWGWQHLLSDRVEELLLDNDYDLEDNPDDTLEQARLVAGGAYRHVWMIREYDGTKRALKTLRVDGKAKAFDLRNFDRHRRDAVAMEQLTSSPLIVNIYGYCSNTGLFDWGEGGDLESLFERQPDISKAQLLHIAYNVSLSIAHAHNFDDKERPTIAHTDIKPDQFLYQDGYYRLTDFNRVRFLMWNREKDLQCGFRVQKNGGIWRAPEEYNYDIETEKVDVYSLGNVLFYLLTRGYPWEDVSTKKAIELVKKKERPPYPAEIVNSTGIYETYMKEAIRMAFVHDKFERPGAFEIAKKLQEGIDKL
jgi:serine/threonine protein kinase